MIEALLLICFITLSVGQVFVGPKYQGQTASAKRNQLAPVLTNDTTPGSFPSLGLGELFVESMDLSFDTVADDMPLQFDGWQRRPKLIHSVGALGFATWVPLPNNQSYTGALTGCKNVIVRFSTAMAPAKGQKGFTPALSVKCLRSGVPSANTFGMFSLEGQDSWNFFKHDLTNHVPDLSSSSSYILREVRSVFAAASDWPTMLGLADFATYDEFGVSYYPKFPFRLVFHPVTSVHNEFSDDPSTEPFEQVIADGLQAGPLYYVYAQDQPTDSQDALVLIGRIDLTGLGTTSNFGDNYLFYQHARMENDFGYRPEWVSAAQGIVNEQQNTPYWTFPDLPFR